MGPASDLRGFFEGDDTGDDASDVDWGALFATLQFHYGAAPCPGGDWLDCPFALVDVYAAMLPRLQAQASLRQVDVIAFPHLKAETQKSLIAYWQQQASGEQPDVAAIGPRQLRNSADVRAWFKQAGYSI